MFGFSHHRFDRLLEADSRLHAGSVVEHKVEIVETVGSRRSLTVHNASKDKISLGSESAVSLSHTLNELADDVCSLEGHEHSLQLKLSILKLRLVDVGEVLLEISDRLIKADHIEEIVKLHVELVANHGVLLDILSILEVETDVGLDTELESGGDHRANLRSFTGKDSTNLLDVL